jgi:three-Cys-motif partner protein
MTKNFPSTGGFRPDEVGEWSERKIDIVSKYAVPYARIVSKKNFIPIYIDGLSGGGTAIRKGSNKQIPLFDSLAGQADTKSTEAKMGEIPTTAVRVLNAGEKFYRYFFIDANPQKIQALSEFCDGRADTDITCGDVNSVLIEKIFPFVQSNKKHRALCFLDPYGMIVSWKVFCAAGQSGKIETFINFPSMDIVRNILRENLDSIEPEHAARMTMLWGDETWKETAFAKHSGFFGDKTAPNSIDRIVAAFRDRLKSLAGFKHVSEALPMKGPQNVPLYHLIFATQQPVALKIATAVLNKRAKSVTLGLHV